MAIGKKTGGRDFKPGTVNNPKGRPKVPEDIKESKKLNQYELELIMNRLLNLKPAELAAEIKSGELSMKEITVANVIQKAAALADHHRLEFILNRIIGKVKEQVEINSHPNLTAIEISKDGNVFQGGKPIEGDRVRIGPNPTIIIRPNGGRTILGTEVEGEHE